MSLQLPRKIFTFRNHKFKNVKIDWCQTKRNSNQNSGYQYIFKKRKRYNLDTETQKQIFETNNDCKNNSTLLQYIQILRTQKEIGKNNMKKIPNNFKN